MSEAASDAHTRRTPRGAARVSRGVSALVARRVKRASLAVTALCLLVLLRQLPLEQLMARLQDLLEGLGSNGPFVLGAVYVAASLLFVPGSALTFAAGAAVGVWLGIVVVSVAATVSAGSAFLIARYLAREHVERAARSRPRFAALDRAVTQGGWKVVVLLRLSPLVPFNVGNYLFGLTGLGFVPYVLASFVGMLPGTVVYVYLGHLGAQSLGAERTQRSPAQWTLLIVGLAATVMVSVLLARLARRRLADHSDAGEDSAEREPSTSDSRERRAPWATIGWASLALVSLGLVACVAVLGGAFPGSSPP